MQILVIDDFDTQREHTKKLLARFEATIDEAVDGEEGLLKARIKKYDLILTDLEMPKLDGVEMCKRIRGMSMNNETPILMISSNADRKEDARMCGINGWLTKPFDSEMIISIVKRFFPELTPKSNKVLLVNDQSDASSVWMSLMDIPGIHFDTTVSASRAMSLIRDNPYRIVVATSSLPGIDGITFINRCKKEVNGKPISFVLVIDNETDSESLSMCEADMVIQKPYELKEIKHKLTSLIGEEVSV